MKRTFFDYSKRLFFMLVFGIALSVIVFGQEVILNSPYGGVYPDWTLKDNRSETVYSEQITYLYNNEFYIYWQVSNGTKYLYVYRFNDDFSNMTLNRTFSPVMNSIYVDNGKIYFYNSSGTYEHNSTNFAFLRKISNDNIYRMGIKNGFIYGLVNQRFVFYNESNLNFLFNSSSCSYSPDHIANVKISDKYIFYRNNCCGDSRTIILNMSKMLETKNCSESHITNVSVSPTGDVQESTMIETDEQFLYSIRYEGNCYNRYLDIYDLNGTFLSPYKTILTRFVGCGLGNYYYGLELGVTSSFIYINRHRFDPYAQIWWKSDNFSKQFTIPLDYSSFQREYVMLCSDNITVFSKSDVPGGTFLFNTYKPEYIKGQENVNPDTDYFNFTVNGTVTPYNVSLYINGVKRWSQNNTNNNSFYISMNPFILNFNSRHEFYFNVTDSNSSYSNKNTTYEFYTVSDYTSSLSGQIIGFNISNFPNVTVKFIAGKQNSRIITNLTSGNILYIKENNLNVSILGFTKLNSTLNAVTFKSNKELKDGTMREVKLALRYNEFAALDKDYYNASLVNDSSTTDLSIADIGFSKNDDGVNVTVDVLNSGFTKVSSTKLLIVVKSNGYPINITTITLNNLSAQTTYPINQVFDLQANDEIYANIDSDEKVGEFNEENNYFKKTFDGLTVYLNIHTNKPEFDNIINQTILSKLSNVYFFSDNISNSDIIISVGNPDSNEFTETLNDYVSLDNWGYKKDFFGYHEYIKAYAEKYDEPYDGIVGYLSHTELESKITSNDERYKKNAIIIYGVDFEGTLAAVDYYLNQGIKLNEKTNYAVYSGIQEGLVIHNFLNKIYTQDTVANALNLKYMNGTITNDNDEPLKNIKVEFWDNTSGVMSKRITVFADENGYYAIPYISSSQTAKIRTVLEYSKTGSEEDILFKFYDSSEFEECDYLLNFDYYLFELCINTKNVLYYETSEFVVP